MKKTFYKYTNPTQTDNVSTGYPLNCYWINTTTYSKYEQISDGVWTWVSNNDLDIDHYDPETINLPTGGTVNILSVMELPELPDPNTWYAIQV